MLKFNQTTRRNPKMTKPKILHQAHPSPEEQQLLSQFDTHVASYSKYPHWYRASLILQIAQRLAALSPDHKRKLHFAEHLMLKQEL